MTAVNQLLIALAALNGGSFTYTNPVTPSHTTVRLSTLHDFTGTYQQAKIDTKYVGRWSVEWVTF